MFLKREPWHRHTFLLFICLFYVRIVCAVENALGRVIRGNRLQIKKLESYDRNPGVCMAVSVQLGKLSWKESSEIQESTERYTVWGTHKSLRVFSKGIHCLSCLCSWQRNLCKEDLLCFSSRTHSIMMGRHGCRSWRQLLTSREQRTFMPSSRRVIWDNSLWHSAFPLQLT